MATLEQFAEKLQGFSMEYITELFYDSLKRSNSVWRMFAKTHENNMTREDISYTLLDSESILKKNQFWPHNNGKNKPFPGVCKVLFTLLQFTSVNKTQSHSANFYNLHGAS